MGVFNTARFIWQHPLSRRHRLRSLSAFVGWQIGSRLFKRPVIYSFVDGAKLVVVRGLTGATGNIYVGLHEFEDMAFVLHVLRADDLFVDIGANVGSYTVLASKVVGAFTIAFEPVPETREWAELNIAVNQIGQRVEMHASALGSKCGTTTFTTDLGSSNRVAVDEGRATEALSHATLEVPITTLDYALAGRCPVCMKIDVEGYESAVIEGASETLSCKELKCLVMEFNGAGRQFGYDEAKLRAQLQTFGFEEFSYRPFQRKLVNHEGGTANNVILVRDREWVQDRLRNAPKFSVMGESL